MQGQISLHVLLREPILALLDQGAGTVGIVKAWMMEMEERGYGESDEVICGACVTDEFLQNWVADNATANACSFCGAKAKSPIAASFEDFTGIVLGGVGFDWNEPTDEGIMYISAEGGWQAPMTTTSEVLYDTGFTENDDVVASLVDMIDNEGAVSLMRTALHTMYAGL